MRTKPSSSRDGGAAARDEARSASLLADRSRPPAKGARSFAAKRPGVAPQPRASWDIALPLVLLALVVVAFTERLAVRVGVPVFLCATALISVTRSARRARRAAEDEASRRSVVFDGERLYFKPEGGEPRVVLSLREPFGMTLVTSAKRDRFVAVWSSPEGLFYTSATFEGAARRGLGPLFDHAYTVLGDDAALEAIGPDGQPLELEPADFAALVFAVEELDPACVERIVLSDARGAPLLLDGRELVVGERRFDLGAPLEWRPFVFQETFGQAVAYYQGTSIRQGASEAVLVALLPSIHPFEPTDSELDRGILRDLRLMQVSTEDPPPRDVRVAIDRLFVLPFRSALDRSPSSSKHASRARA